MRPHKLLATIAAASMTLAPIASHATLAKQSGASALALSAGLPSRSAAVNKVRRAGTPAGTESKFGGDSTILLILAVILIGAGIFVLADNSDDSPTSP